ncbi:hypothetical protein Q9L42_018135 [Methylomarinum sp. Ch1-1]|uniref:Uncharacterized protein n=1 Tax=Methylomarinum roseum TaxID=3067653 RepID=A0AAU7NTD6_9GAMM|nr:hypothetical protein [Methylomarinum sp. Ch1-1]MDP4519719.1 hypothetical protein [Methylomarinum sp. Ch1-1]
MDTLKQYLPLCWFTANPLDLPRSVRFFRLNLLFYFIVELFIQINMIEYFEAIFEVTLETGLTLVFVGLVVLLNKSGHSFIQVSSAILFCENVVAVVVVPTMIWLTITEDELSYVTMAFLMLWDFSLVAYVYKKTLGINTAAGAVVSLFYFTCTYGFAYGITSLIIG